MPAALLGATRCSRCGHEQSPASTCDHCQARWAPAAIGTVTGAPEGPLAGVARASVGRRYLAHLIDLIVPLGLVGLALASVVDLLPDSRAWWFLVLAVVVVVVQCSTVAVRGRSLGRLVLAQRTVDDLTGTPVRSGRFVRQLAQRGWYRHLVTADLRRGRDPLDIRLPPPAAGDHPTPTVPSMIGPVPTGPSATSLPVPGPTTGLDIGLEARIGVGAARPASPAGPPSPAGPASPAGPPSPASRAKPPLPATPVIPATPATRRSVGIVLDTGERYEISESLLLGRSPVDPSGRGDRALLAWPDLTRRVAKTHVLLEWSGTVLWVTDLHSVTGTVLVDPAGDRQLLAPDVRAAAVVGSTVECGGRSVKVVPNG